MEKIRSFLGVLVSLFVISIPGKVLAADVYVCNELIEYVECNANFYLAGNSLLETSQKFNINRRTLKKVFI